MLPALCWPAVFIPHDIRVLPELPVGGGWCYGIWDLGFEGLKKLGFGRQNYLGFGENIWDLGFEVDKS